MRSHASTSSIPKSSLTPIRSGLLQRKCNCGNSAGLTGKCTECESKQLTVQKKTTDQAKSSAAPAIVHNVLASPGQPLDSDTRSFMESRFKHDFSQVRVHTDAKAAASAQAVKAQAYTTNQDIVFDTGRYQPQTLEGKRLLAHELTHVLQQRPIIARQAETIPVGEFTTRGSGLERALTYEPRLRPHVPRAPTISPPPFPPPPAPLPNPCPSAVTVQRELQQSNLATQTEAQMRNQIAIAQSRSASQISFRPVLITQTDRAIRREFGSLLPTGRNFAARSSTSVLSPNALATNRIPNNAAARQRIGEIALDIAPETLRNLCITEPNHAQLQSEIVSPVFNQMGIALVRDYEEARIGGQTTFPTVAGVVRPHVDIPSVSRNLGHIIMHEAMHFYVHPVYHATAEQTPIEDELMEGGAEFLTRQVIHQQLGSNPDFQINYNTYASYFQYVANNLLRGGLSSFSLAYFQGHVDLLGLTRVQPKLNISMPEDPYEQEADRMAETILQMPDSNVTQPSFRMESETGQSYLQTPEILIQRSPTFNTDCTEYDRCRVIEPISVANQLIDRVLTVLPPIANGTITSGRIVDLLNVHFHDPSAIVTRSNAVLMKFQEIKTELNSTNFICHPTAGDCESEEGRVGAFTRLCSPGSAINLCQTYYEQVCAEKARLLIHEAAHNVIGSCRDYAYVHEPGYMTLSAEQASLNSDTYAQFAKMVFLGSPNCKDCSSEVQLHPGRY